VARVTLKTVAERVGVSSMTVSNAFSRPDQLSAALREKILAAAAELGYAGPDPAGRTLARGSTGTIGILITDSLRYAFTDEFSAEFLTAIAEELARGGLALTLLPPDGVGNVVPTRDVAMDGAIVYSCSVTGDGLEQLRRRRLPLVQVDQPDDALLSSVKIEDRVGARQAAQHVVDLGHRRIALIGVGSEADLGGGNHLDHRVHGWRDALDPAGVEPVIVYSPQSTEDGGADAVRPLLIGPDRPTAVLCFSDAVAAGAVRAAQDAGLTVPRDLSVVGYDDSPLARRVRPALTTVRQDAVAKGRITAALLIDALARKRSGAEPEITHVVLPTELVVRDSTTTPPAPGPPVGT
jgi:DNA-binding LacI/PurR family transcriptional regulator